MFLKNCPERFTIKSRQEVLELQCKAIYICIYTANLYKLSSAKSNDGVLQLPAKLKFVAYQRDP